MVARANVIETNSKCSCGNGDTKTAKKNYFSNKCPNCGKEGSLQLETQSNFELQNNSANSTSDNSNATNTTTNNTNNQSNYTDNPTTKIVCKSCGSEYCGQDGYDLIGGTRSSLSTVNPNEVTDEEEDEETSDSEEGNTTYMSGWEGLCDLLKPLDGQAMMVQRGDYVVVKKIEMPQTAKLWAYEGINVVDDSVSVTDYTPEIYNTFIIKWGETYENELEFTFNKHKELFGERKTVVEAKKIQVVEDENSEEENSDNNSNTNNNSNNSSNNSNSDESNKNTRLGVTDSILLSSDTQKALEDANVSTDGDLTSTENTETPQTEEVPITDREEAIQFGLTEIGKAKRDDGHTITLKVIGNQNWQMGEWCHVRLPSFNEDCYMFISKCGFESSADSEYINSLTLVDYPPSLGKPSKKQNSEENTDSQNSESGTNEDNTTTTGTDNSTNSTDSTNQTNTDSNNNTQN